MALAARARPSLTLATVGLGVCLAGAIWVAAARQTRGGRSRAVAAGSAILVPSVLLIGLFAGLLLGSARIASLEDCSLAEHVEETTRVEAVITGPVRWRGGWQSAAVTVRRCEAEWYAGGEKAWLEVPPDDDVALLCQGMVVNCRVRVEAPEGPGDSGYDQRRWLLQQGICVVLRAVDGESLLVTGRRAGVAGAFDRLREAARQHLALGPDSRVNEVLEGVVTGDTAGIEEDWLEAFRRSGTAHMLSVSGLHVASLAAIMFGLGRLLRLPRGASFVLAAGAAVLMIPFVGPSPPIIRAAVMIVIVLVGRWVGRGRDQWQILALAAVVILTMNPYALFDVGFQLSFSAFIGMMALGPPLQRVLRRLPAGIAANVAVSLAAGAGTAPVALAQFGRTSLISPLANLLVVPTLPVVTGLGMASVFVGFMWHGLSVACDTIASLPMMWTVMVSRMMGRAPVLESADAGLAVGAVLGGVLALPAAMALTGRATGASRGLRLPLSHGVLAWLRSHRPRHRAVAVTGAVAVVALGMCAGLGAWSAGDRSLEAVQTALGGRGWPDAVELRVLDVGQGNAVLVRTPEHHTLLFDGGPKGCGLAGQLRSLGVRRLDLLVISHPHADHFAGVLEALPELEVGMLVDQVQVTWSDPRGPPADGRTVAAQAGAEPVGSGGEEALQYLEFRRLLAEQGCRYLLAGPGERISVDSVHLTCFAPARPLALLEGSDPWGARGGPPTGDELNAASLVVVLNVGRTGVVLPGDAEAGALAAYGLPRADVLVVPHHGSRGAVTARMLEQVGISAGIISVGEDNSFGHPDPSTLSLLADAGVTTLRTDAAGWICCSLEAERMYITTERDPTR